MSDEIDIEEHDVMDNPTIKRIFPDLTVIKKEINQYYDEGFNALPDNTVEETIPEAVFTNDSTALLPELLHDNDESSFMNAPELTGTLRESRYLQSNMIILGSKPSLGWQNNKYNCNSTKKREPKLVLQNVSPFLNRCKRYCKKCLILFPKPNVLTIHMINIHRIKNGDNTTKSKKFMKRKQNKCNTCNMTLSSRSNLIRHFRNLHGNGKKNKALNIPDKIIDSNEVSKTKKSTGLSCFHCKVLFPSQSSLIEHLYQVLDPVTGANNSTCSKETKKIYNNRLIEEQYDKKIDKSQNIECTQCMLDFCSQEKYDKHVRDNHHESKEDTDDCSSHHNLTLTKNNKRKFAKSVVGVLQYNDENNENVTSNRKNKQVGFKKDGLQLNNKCNKCSQNFNSHRELEYHTRSVHRTKIRFIHKNNVSKIKRETIKSHKTFYKCFVCSKYNITFEFYSRHMVTDHNIKEVTTVKKVPFNSKCELCPSKMSGVKSYNAHIYKYHKMKLRETIVPVEQSDDKDREILSKDIQFAVKSTLFKCLKCEFFFLKSNTAMDHINHSKILNKWECSNCLRLFKKEDKELHMKQHLFSQTLNVHALSESEFRRVLYKCSGCTVHYSEENFVLHHQKCDTETPNSLYCRLCDVLINKDDMDFHEFNHIDKQITCFDFTIIESDVIVKNRLRSNKIKHKKYTYKRNKRTNENLQENSKLVMHFCHTCKCFVNINYTRNIHMEARCGHMLKYVCKECGLILTMKTHATHKGIHKTKQLNLQDYLFYDLRTKKQICPPIPEYPKCNMCGVHFLRNVAIRVHSCHDQDYITCDICSIKLTEHAYKLHMSFHNYSIQNVDAELKDTDSELRPTNNISCEDSHSPVVDNISTVDIALLYTCKGCQITINTYEKVVQHCQDHYDCKKVQLDVDKCQNCNLVFDRSDYESHLKLHVKGNYNNNSLTVDFDPFYFRFNNGFWTKHIFSYVADEQIGKILDTSIYKYECRLKMEELQPGSSSLMLYKCEKCLSFIDPHSLYMHVKNAKDKSCVELRKFPCAFCGLCFGSINYRIFHEKEHKCIDINLKAYTIISFNKMEHETFNSRMFEACNKFILYQCRNCDQVIDKFQRKDHKCDLNHLKICSSCGLFLQRQDYDLHFIRHEELDQFNAKNITVVMFGKKSDARMKELVGSTFSGNIYDYTIYKCKTCDLCLRTKICISNHVCVFDDSKLKCPKCGLYFLKSELKFHSELHENNLEFDELNRNIIPFDGSSVALDVAAKETGKNTEDVKETIEEVDRISLDKEITKDCSKKLERIYKCNCGLHFLEELNALHHSNNCHIRMKISRQSCFKCDLLFTPGELFNHLLKHHCDKKLQYTFDIVSVSKKENKIPET